MLIYQNWGYLFRRKSTEEFWLNV